MVKKQKHGQDNMEQIKAKSNHKMKGILSEEGPEKKKRNAGDGSFSSSVDSFERKRKAGNKGG